MLIPFLEPKGDDTHRYFNRNNQRSKILHISQGQHGWVTSVALEYKEASYHHMIYIYFDNLPLHCRTCQTWKHKVKGCKEIQNSPSHAHHAIQHEKGEVKAVDYNGFQQLTN